MDFIAIGDTTMDTFIKLKDAEVHCDINNEHCTISMRFGDKIPFESATLIPAVGNAANAAVAARRLGLSTGFVAWLGEDRDGTDCLAALEKEGIDTRYVRTQKGKQTNSHYVLWYGDERTILIKHEAFDCTLPAKLEEPKTVYLSSLAEHALPLHDELADWLSKHPRVRFAFQPGTFQIKAGLDRLHSIYARTDIFFANKEEYQRVLGTAEEDVRKLIERMHTRGPRICVLTDGPHGAYASNLGDAYRIPLYPDPKPPFERTGAGDAFSSSIAIALTLGRPLEEALLWGPINAMSVVQYVGAQEGLLSYEKILEHLKNAPTEFRLSPLS